MRLLLVVVVLGLVAAAAGAAAALVGPPVIRPIPPVPPAPGVRVSLVDYEFSDNETIMTVMVQRPTPCVLVWVPGRAVLVDGAYYFDVYVNVTGEYCIMVLPRPQYFVVHGPLPAEPGVYRVYARIHYAGRVSETRAGEIIYGTPSVLGTVVYKGVLAELVGAAGKGWYLYRDHAGRLIALPVLVVPSASAEQIFYEARGALRGKILYAEAYRLWHGLITVPPPIPIQG